MEIDIRKLKEKTAPVYKYLHHNLLVVHREDPLLWFHLMQANVQLIYPNFIVQEISFVLSLLQLLITQIQWQMIFCLKKICFKAAIFISPNMPGFEF
jgi:hypothetical protein